MSYYFLKYNLVRRTFGERETTDVEYYPSEYHLLKDVETRFLGLKKGLLGKRPLQITTIDGDTIMLTSTKEIVLLSGVRQGYKLTFPKETKLSPGTVLFLEKESFCVIDDPANWIHWADTPLLETQVDY